MISVTFDDSVFQKEMKNLMAYSEGFLDGAKSNKKRLLHKLGYEIKEMLGNFIDSNARVNPESLHHVYEWYQTGSPDARLFDLECVISNDQLNISGELTQSKSVSKGSKDPFYNKANVMEAGLPITIKPKNSSVLAFDVNGETVFTSKPVRINKPGGDVMGQFAETFSLFFKTYGSQSILEMSGLADHLKNSKEFDKKFSAGKTGGRSLGYSTGAKWISGGSI